MIETVYFDMDGVLTNLYSHILEYMDKPFSKERVRPWLIANITEQSLFEIIPPNPNLDEIIDLMDDLGDYDVEILTSLGGMVEGGLRNEIIDQKIAWLKKHLGKRTYSMLTAFNAVDDCQDKAAYASNNRFLIDDRSFIINDFQIAGGNGYHYGNDRHESSLEAIEAILL